MNDNHYVDNSPNKDKRNSKGLASEVDHRQNWPTPAARDYKGANSREHCEVNGTGRKHMDQLPNAVKYITPRVGGEESLDSVEKRKGREAAERHNTLASVEAAHGEQPGQLNPDWVEWLMGWPIGWTSLDNAQEVVWARDCACECGEDECKGECGCTLVCPRCGGDYSVCRDIGPTEEDVRYEERDGILYGTRTDLDWRDWKTDPADEDEIPRVATGIKNRVGRLKAIGNGQVPQVAAMAWRILSK
jgi:hypothetical protein